MAKAKPKKAKRNRGICYLCGKAGADTTEHVVASMFFRKDGAPKKPLTLPAHRRCNKSTEAAEQRIFISMAVTRDPRLGIGEQQDRAYRSINRSEADALARSILKSTSPLPEGGATMTVPMEAIAGVLGKIAKGLIYERHGVRLLEDVRWRFSRIDPHDFFGMQFNFRREVDDVLAARWLLNEANPRRMAMGLAFWGLHHYFAFSALPDEKPDWMALSWPRPVATVAPA